MHSSSSTLITLLLVIMEVSVAWQPFLQPYFFLCNYHGNPDTPSLDQGEVALSVSIEGNPEYYVPGQKYEVTITSSQDFDGFMLTGLYTMKSKIQGYVGNPVGGDEPFGQNFMCSHVHNHISHERKHELSFVWMAPQKGTGCISFLATATLGHQLLFKDTIVMQLCEEGEVSLPPPRPTLTTIHEDGFIFRDDFDSSPWFNMDLWTLCDNVIHSTECGTILHGQAGVACQPEGIRLLQTVPLNLTEAAVVQFTLSSGKCRLATEEEPIVFSYSDVGCKTFTQVENITGPMSRGTNTVIQLIPLEARQDDVCLQWEQLPAANKTSYTGCWAMDNFYIHRQKGAPQQIADDFDPIDPTNWIFFPGAKIRHKCHSENNALVFENDFHSHNYVTSRELDLHIHNLPAIMEQDFEGILPKSWLLEGGAVGGDCGLVQSGLSLEMTAAATRRRLCTPFMDLSQAASLRFFFGFGIGSCNATNNMLAKAVVYTENRKGHSKQLHILTRDDYNKVSRFASVFIPPRARHQDARICWIQKHHGGIYEDTWALDGVSVLKELPPQGDLFVQFKLNLHCGKSDTNTSVVLEASTDHGATWFPLQEPCLPGQCEGPTNPTSSTFTGHNINGWERITLPIPTLALTPFTRFRWKQSQFHGNWALDNVYIGYCPDGCNGRGDCSYSGCQCDFGFTGPACNQPLGPLPSMIIESMVSIGSITLNFNVVKGASLNYDCGLVGSGKAVVFHKDGPRVLETVDLNTTSIRYIQFSVRVGSNSVTGDCPPPDQNEEVVILQYTCTGGVYWHLLKQLQSDNYREPKVVSLHLPHDIHNSVCRFRWWQPVHSGAGSDVWAIDDVSLTDTMYNTINLDFSDIEETEHALDIHLGMLDYFCGRFSTLSFVAAHQEGEYRYVMTNSMQIGPSYMIQFELVMGCSHQFLPEIDNRVYLEFSIDHGMSWKLVRDGCWPPRMCDEYHAPSEYHASQFQDWTRVTILLPSSTWSSSTRFRFRQSRWTTTDSWALGYLYIGQQCPKLCQGHGLCHQGVCKCDSGYAGETCTPTWSLPSHLKTDFSMLSSLERDWHAILGGEIVGANQGCGTLLSGESMYFYEEGPRELSTHDLDTTLLDYLQFYTQVGGSNDLHCYGVDSRSEHVLVQYSNNGGVTWHLLKELQADDYSSPRFVYIALPSAAKTSSSRFRWWQPLHSGAAVDQWAVDEVSMGSFTNMHHLMADFEQRDPADTGEDIWLTITEGMEAPYCQSPDSALMFANQNNDKIAVTKDMLLVLGDVIQFRINVGCSSVFSFHHPVLFEYSADAGMTWSLVEKPCYLQDKCHKGYSEGSIYYTGTFGEWSLVVLPVSEHIVNRRVNFRWWQKGGWTSSFALDDVYIGPPCPQKCNGHGVCGQGQQCICDPGYTAPNCTANNDEPAGMIDRFDNMNRPGELWASIHGGQLGMGCGIIGGGNSLYFNGDGAREARTVALNTTHISLVQFQMRIGDVSDRRGCRKPQGRSEGVVVDYSTDNGIEWHELKTLDPESLSDAPQTLLLTLPDEAKGPATAIRWWQPIITPGSPRAEWAIDDVVIAVNDSSFLGFEETFNPVASQDVWYMAMNAVPKITCQSHDNALEFSKNGGRMRYAETWDYEVNPSTFLQFDIAMGCSGTYSTLYGVMLEYSTDRGRSWHPVAEECLPPQMDCSGYHLSSMFMSNAHANWTRVTLYLPPGAVSHATRFRWLQEKVTLRGNVWALDNIYLGSGCPWMCSGHGYCRHGNCVCDPGFFGPFCVPSAPLPMGLRDSMDGPSLDPTAWPELYGGDITNICGMIVSGPALTFYKENLRSVTTRDLDVSMSIYIQFTFQYGCQYQQFDWPREHAVLLQYSNNGGILWSLLKEIHYINFEKPRYFNVRIPTPAQTNATRFRFWQPKHAGHMKSVWSIDNLLVGGSVINPDRLYEVFDTDPSPDQWLFWPGGKVASFCSFNTRSDTITAGQTSLVFSRGPGEHSITTHDLTITDASILQFDINIGCSSQSSKIFPVQLQYSVDSGRTWNLVIPECSRLSTPTCQDQNQDATVYYAGSSPYWKRILVPLHGLHICGTARFRWYQGVFSTKDLAPEWAIDNLYIGMQCQDHCGGHGTCVQGMICLCDDGYGGQNCASSSQKPTFVKEDFESDIPGPLALSRWLAISGADWSAKCGVLLSGKALYFNSEGVRQLTTVDLDLTVAQVIQFFIKLGCGKPGLPIPAATEPVLLQYSIDGGTHWNTIEILSFQSTIGSGNYIAIQMPEAARTNSTRVRWWQPTQHGEHLTDWAIDQIYIGGDINGRMVLDSAAEPVHSDLWLMTPGATIQQTCGLKVDALHFNEANSVRYAMTADVAVTVATFLQFYISLGCSSYGKCYSVELQYSLDFGKTWHLLETECMPSDVECDSYHGNSVFTSDVHSGWQRVSIPLPYYTRSKATRFRWVQFRDFEAVHTWSLTQVYIGDECFCSCAGHGRCRFGVCVCDEGWGGESCGQPLDALPSLLSDSFTVKRPEKASWAAVLGGETSELCGVLASGPSLHFKGLCTRQLITRDLDLQEAQFVQFYFKFGCISPPEARDEGVLVDYTTDAGTRWHKMIELYYDQYKNASFVMIELPKQAKYNGVRIRWWQPHHPGGSRSDWAIDNVFIGGKETNPNEVTDEFSDGPWIDKWIEYDNSEIHEYCGSASTIMGEATSKEHVKLTTSDVDIREGYILQFSISVGCDADWDTDISPVHLQYSTDFGRTWSHLVGECLPFYPECNGKASIPTIYYAHRGWRRETIVLDGVVVSRATRFRWMQVRDPAMKAADQHWALDHVYIGPACQDVCHGHGNCDFPNCRCDKGYGGDACIQVDKIRHHLKDTFSGDAVNERQWSLVQGGHVTTGCGELVSGTGLHFTGHGQRLAQTIDLDLRNARFVQYYALIGGASTKTECGVPKSRNDSVVLQYSTNGGISWHILHILDYTDYWIAPKLDYVPIPLHARTEATRIRWWQTIGPTKNGKQDLSHFESNGFLQNDHPMGWTLDDVYIGGSEINPSILYETFDTNLDETQWEFYPNGILQSGVCNRESRSLSWDSKVGIKRITTGQLIVQEGYMIQFKIHVGCGDTEHQCNSHQPVVLQYNKDPMVDSWELVYPRCLLRGHETNMECRPYHFHQGTVYTANEHAAWTRVSLDLPQKVFSSMTRFRWLQQNTSQQAAPAWALDDVYIGESCPSLCSGRGQCVRARCVCDPGYYGDKCQPIRTQLLSHMTDGFESGVSPTLWSKVDGGRLGLGCGSLHPLAHGKTLYFNGCGLRQVITTEMDVTKASKVMFVLKIGSAKQTPTCNVDLTVGSSKGTVLLQYTPNKGIDWYLLATHEPEEFLQARRVAYEIPPEARNYGIQFRWWQPEHRGVGFDQWAVDQVEIIIERYPINFMFP